MKKELALLIAVSLVMGAVCPGFTAESNVLSENSSVDLAAQSRWKDEMAQAKSTRTTMFVLAGIGVAAGTGVIVSGVSDKNAAEESEGCSGDGGLNVVCGTQEQADEAQSKLDAADKKITLGAIVLGVGVVFAILGIKKNGEIQSLERRGRRNGFAWNFDVDQTNKVNTKLSYVF